MAADKHVALFCFYSLDLLKKVYDGIQMLLPIRQRFIDPETNIKAKYYYWDQLSAWHLP